jgi:hypothetical protein
MNSIVTKRLRSLINESQTDLLEVSDGISAILLALEAREVHLGLRDVLLGVQKVLIEGTVVPLNTCSPETVNTKN